MSQPSEEKDDNSEDNAMDSDYEQEEDTGNKIETIFNISLQGMALLNFNLWNLQMI